MSAQASPRLFIGGLKRNVEKEELMEEFKEFGEVVDLWIAYDPPGFAFIEFEKEDSAKAALEARHKTVVFGSEIRVEFTRKKDDMKKDDNKEANKPRLFIGGIKETVEKEDVRCVFEKFGNVTDVWIAHNPPGFAFVEFDNEASANTAVDETNGTEIFGGTVRVQITKGRREGRRNRVNEIRDRGAGRGSRRGGRGGEGGGHGNHQRRYAEYRGSPYHQPPPPAARRPRDPYYPPYPPREPYYPPYYPPPHDTRPPRPPQYYGQHYY